MTSTEPQPGSLLTQLQVYTCQKPQPKRCSFFIWADVAKVREESAVLSNSRSEPEPQTPRKSTSRTRLPPTPLSESRPNGEAKDTSPTKSTGETTTKEDSGNNDSFDWPSSDDAELAQTAARIVMPPQFETPRRVARTEKLSSPGKRTHHEMEDGSSSTWPNPTSSDDVFSTPNTSNRSHGLLSPVNTPAHRPTQVPGGQAPAAAENSTLAADALHILARMKITQEVEDELVVLLNRHDLRVQGIVKGRDITRLAVQAKDKKIAELQARIAGLEAERETSRAVIAHLKQDIGQTSPSQQRRGRGKLVDHRSPGNGWDPS